MAEKIIPRIDGVLKEIIYIQKEMAEVSFEEFMEQRLLPEAICFSLAQIGERMNKLEELIGHKYPNIPWKEARKMRNIIVHDYDGVDFKKVYSTVINDLPVLKEQLLQVKDDMNRTKEYSLLTERLILRPWDDFDVDELFELAKEPEIGQWCGWEPHKTISDSLFALHNFLEVKETYAICLIDSKSIIGCISLTFPEHCQGESKDCELGYWIGKPYWNRGYITEAARELIRHAFEDLNVSKISCAYFSGNERSKQVIKKLGFVYYCSVLKDNETKLSLVNILTKEEWQRINKDIYN